MEKYIVITADVIASKKHKDFKNIFKRRVQNLEYPESVKCPFEIAKGDEMQAVFNSELDIPKYIRQLRYCMLPLKIRIGIGVGEVKDQKNIKVWKSEGEAFEFSAKALALIDKDRKFKTKVISDSPQDEMVNTIFLLMDALVSEWNRTTWNLVNVYDNSESPQQAAETLMIDSAELKCMCKDAHLEEVYHAENNLNRIIARNI